MDRASTQKLIIVAVFIGILILSIYFLMDKSPLAETVWDIHDIIVQKKKGEIVATVLEKSNDDTFRNQAYYYVPNKILKSYDGRWFSCKTGVRAPMGIEFQLDPLRRLFERSSQDIIIKSVLDKLPKESLQCDNGCCSDQFKSEVELFNKE